MKVVLKILTALFFISSLVFASNINVEPVSLVSTSIRQFQVLGYTISPQKDLYKPGENITVSIVLNLPDLPNDIYDKQYVEVAILPKSLAERWFGPLSIPEYKADKALCDPLQPNFAGTWVSRVDLNPTSDPFTVRLTATLTIPYKGIRVPSTGEQYWQGPGEYVIVVYSTNGCWKDLAPEGKYKVYGWQKVTSIYVGSKHYDINQITSLLKNIYNYLLHNPIIIVLLVILLIILLIPSSKNESVKVIIVPIEKIKK